MSIELIFKRVVGLTKIYGNPLYELLENLGEVFPRDYQYDEVEGIISITFEDKSIYLPVRKETIAEGILEDQILSIGKFQASRDAIGVFNGESFVIEKGKVKLFAY